MSEYTDTHDELSHDEHEGMSKGKIWKVFFILLIITVVEFIIALYIKPKGYLGEHHVIIGNVIYIVLTLFKAFYIIAYFMHLKFEKRGLQMVLSLSFLLIVYLIVLMLIEGDYLSMHMPNQ